MATRMMTANLNLNTLVNKVKSMVVTRGAIEVEVGVLEC